MLTAKPSEEDNTALSLKSAFSMVYPVLLSCFNSGSFFSAVSVLISPAIYI